MPATETLCSLKYGRNGAVADDGCSVGCFRSGCGYPDDGDHGVLLLSPYTCLLPCIQLTRKVDELQRVRLL